MTELRDHSNREPTWADLSKRERLAFLGESLKPHERGAIMARVEKHFRGQRGARLNDPMYALNVVLREAWREEHGSTEEWDRAAAASLAAGNDIRAVPHG
jgi:hypothetical protein